MYYVCNSINIFKQFFFTISDSTSLCHFFFQYTVVYYHFRDFFQKMKYLSLGKKTILSFFTVSEKLKIVNTENLEMGKCQLSKDKFCKVKKHKLLVD